jgi:hypothetical protein
MTLLEYYPNNYFVMSFPAKAGNLLIPMWPNSKKKATSIIGDCPVNFSIRAFSATRKDNDNLSVTLLKTYSKTILGHNTRKL